MGDSSSDDEMMGVHSPAGGGDASGKKAETPIADDDHDTPSDQAESAPPLCDFSKKLPVVDSFFDLDGYEKLSDERLCLNLHKFKVRPLCLRKTKEKNTPTPNRREANETLQTTSDLSLHYHFCSVAEWKQDDVPLFGVPVESLELFFIQDPNSEKSCLLRVKSTKEVVGYLGTVSDDSMNIRGSLRVLFSHLRPDFSFETRDFHSIQKLCERYSDFIQLEFLQVGANEKGFLEYFPPQPEESSKHEHLNWIHSPSTSHLKPSAPELCWEGAIICATRFNYRAFALRGLPLRLTPLENALTEQLALNVKKYLFPSESRWNGRSGDHTSPIWCEFRSLLPYNNSQNYAEKTSIRIDEELLNHALKFPLFDYQMECLKWLVRQDEITPRPFQIDTSISLFHQNGFLRTNTTTMSLFDRTNHKAWNQTKYDCTLRGVILADEMGLGKTVEILSLVCLTLPRAIESVVAYNQSNHSSSTDDDYERVSRNSSNSNSEPTSGSGSGGGVRYKNHPDEWMFGFRRIRVKATLVVCPSGLVSQWASEAKKFTNLDVLTIHSTSTLAKVSNLRFLAADLIIINYKVFNSDAYFSRFDLVDAVGQVTSDPTLGTKNYINRLRKCAQFGATMYGNEFDPESLFPVLELFLFERIVIDESSDLNEVIGRKRNSMKFCVSDLGCARSMILTSGTPLSKGIVSMSAIFKCLLSPSFDSRRDQDFREGPRELIQQMEYSTNNGLMIYAALCEIFSACCWSNSKQSIRDQIKLPPITEEIIRVDLTPFERNMIWNEVRMGRKTEAMKMCAHLLVSDFVRNVLQNDKNAIHSEFSVEDEPGSGTIQSRPLSSIQQLLLEDMRKNIAHCLQRMPPDLKQFLIDNIQCREIDGISLGVGRELCEIEISSINQLKSFESRSVFFVNAMNDIAMVGYQEPANEIVHEPLPASFKPVSVHNPNPHPTELNPTLEKKLETPLVVEKKQEKEEAPTDPSVFCPICLESYNGTDRKCVVSHVCGHTMCSTCVGTMWAMDHFQSFIKCPDCRSKISKSQLSVISTVDLNNQHQRDSASITQEMYSTYNNPPKSPGSSSGTKLTEDPEEDQSEAHKWANVHGSKIARVARFINETVTSEDTDNYKVKFILFSQWPEMLHLIRMSLSDCGIRSVIVSGSAINQTSAVDRFKSDANARVLLMTSNGNASGLNLTEATHVLFVDVLSCSAHSRQSIEAQAVCRAHRIGQTRPVRVTRFIAKNTIEERIFDSQ